MRRRERAKLAALVLALAAGVLGQGCGDDDDGPSARFIGNVSGVSPTQASVPLRSRPLHAAIDWMMPPLAHAQSTCGALHVLMCASNGRDDAVCRGVDADSCSFDVSLDVLDNFFAGGSLFFVDDANGNGREDADEDTAILTNPVGLVCNGSVVTLTDVAIDFLGGSATAISVVKNPDTCSATAVPTSGFTPIPTVPYGASLNQPPGTMLAFLFGAGALGLIIPRRRSRT